jgi:D-alanyl-D-alanine carboxypeptidase (penicillin-binding protein 5/6)
VGSLEDLYPADTGSAAVLAAPPQQDSAAATSSVVASGSDHPDNTLALRAGVGIVGAAVVLMLVLCARRLSRRR